MKPNTLTEAETKAGWKLLFNGTDLTGWHNFKSEKIKPGWQVKDGELVCADPHNAGDLCTADQYDWFELQLDFKMGEGANSGIIYHVTDAGGAVWATGPEIQLEDNAKATDKERCGWLYALYKQGSSGDVSTKRPGMLDVRGRAKWDAWNGKKGTTQDAARDAYVALAKRLGA